MSEFERDLMDIVKEARENDDTELETPVDLNHVFQGICIEATQGQFSSEQRYQSATLSTSHELCSPEVRIRYFPHGAPLEFGKRYRVTIEELP